MARWIIVPLFRSYFVRCPSGAFKRVFWSAERAFPSSVPGFDAKLSSNIDTDVLTNTKFGAKYKKKADALLFSLDELNGDLQLLFRGAYVLYQTDPCEHGEELRAQIRDITARHQQLRAASVGIRSYVEMMKDPDADVSIVTQKYIELAHLLRLPDGLAAATALDLSRNAAARMTEVQ